MQKCSILEIIGIKDGHHAIEKYIFLENDIKEPQAWTSSLILPFLVKIDLFWYNVEQAHIHSPSTKIIVNFLIISIVLVTLGTGMGDFQWVFSW